MCIVVVSQLFDCMGLSSADPFFLAPASDAPQQGVGILLIHGFTGSPANMRDMGNFLASRGYMVHGMRIAGHGTHPDDLNRTTVGEWFASAEDGLQQIRKHCDTAAVIGFSFGGNLALHLATTFSKNIQSVVVIGMPLYINKPWRVRIKTIASHVVQVPHVPKSSAHAALPLVEPSGAYNVWPTRAMRELLNFLRRDAHTPLSKIQQPLLIIQSVTDSVVNPKSAHAIYHAAPSTQKEIFWLTHSLHYPINGSQREEVHGRIHEFIQKSSSSENKQ